MKIGEIKPGTEYAAAEVGRHGALPRRVTALGVETIEKEYWAGGGTYTSRRAKKTVRVIKVRFEDEPTRVRRYGSDVFSIPKGTETTLEARLLVAPWADVNADAAYTAAAEREDAAFKRYLQKRIAETQAKADAKALYEGRVKALLPKKLQEDGEFYVTPFVRGENVRVEMRLSGDALDEIIRLAEIGFDDSPPGKTS